MTIARAMRLDMLASILLLTWRLLKGFRVSKGAERLFVSGRQTGRGHRVRLSVLCTVKVGAMIVGILNAPVLAAGQKFEVASVKPVQTPAGAGRAARRGCAEVFKLDRSQVEIECATLTTLIGYAFRISPDRVKGPDWMAGRQPPRFEIVAKLPEGAAERQVPEMLQELLADRFKLAVHRGTTEQVFYALAVAKEGLKVKEAAPAAVAEQDATPGTIAPFGDVVARTSPAPGGGFATTMSKTSPGEIASSRRMTRSFVFRFPRISISST